MEPRQNSWQVVVAGYWNRMIFSPEWVGENLFQRQRDIETLVAFVPEAPVVYRNNELELQISATRLVVAARQTTAQGLMTAEAMACRILDLLPNTPIIAVGVNFGFVETTPNAHLLGLFNLNDDAEITHQGWGIDGREWVRNLSREGQILNLTLSFRTAEVTLDANFHYPAARAGTARDLLQGRTEQMHASLHALIRAAYDPDNADVGHIAPEGNNDA